MIKLTIGNINITLHNIDKSLLPVNILKFCSSHRESDLNYYFTFVPKIYAKNDSNYRIIFANKDLTIYKDCNEHEIRELYFPENHELYAIYQETSNRNINITICTKRLQLFKFETIFVSTLSLEKQLYLHNSFIFHCSYLDFEGKAILFSGPSGIGKTTHTNLWCQYLPDRAKVLNGDKCLLSREGNTFYANGWPICGSSGICHNERREVRAVVLLQQAPENRLIEEKKILTFRRVLEQLTVNYWNREFTEAAMTFADSLVSTLPCFTYGCNISREAVDILYQQLITANK